MTNKTQPTAHAEITAPISADLRRIESAHPASDRDTHFFLAGWNGARRGDDSHTTFRSAKRYAPASLALQAAPPAQAPERAELAERIKNEAAHWAYMAEIDNGDAANVSRDKHAELVAQLAAAPAQAVATDERQRMTAGRASFFMERFLKEEKLLGPNEQAALHFVIDMLAAPAQAVAVPEGWAWVPRNPTLAMMCAAVGPMGRREMFRNMVDAAPADAPLAAPAQEHATQPLGCTRSHPHENMSPMCVLRTEIARLNHSAAIAQVPFQQRVQPWLLECFGAEIAGDKKERNHRFLEESVELVQANGCTASEAHQLVDYVFGRPVGEPAQEVGGVMVTLAALCLASGLDMRQAGEDELARIWGKVEQIRAKQAAKPKHSPLPAAPAQAQEDAARLDAMQAQRIAVVPEFEGPWDATIYGDSDEPIARGSGNTPREAIDAARAAQGGVA